jgi:uncharacterized protein with von Willebrand factor type A (vWA) domain
VRPHIVLVIDRSGSMDDPIQKWCDTFNELVDSVRYFSNTPLVSVLLFDSVTKMMSFKVPADHMERFQPHVNFTPQGGTLFYRGLEVAIERCLTDKETQNLQTQFIAITDGGVGDWPQVNQVQIYAEAKKKGWGIALVGPGATAMRQIKDQIPGVLDGDVCLVEPTKAASLTRLGLKGSEALEEWMKRAAIGKAPKENFFGATTLNLS